MGHVVVGVDGEDEKEKGDEGEEVEAEADSGEAEVEAESTEAETGAEDGTGGADKEDVSNVQLAWEMLDMARLICERYYVR